MLLRVTKRLGNTFFVINHKWGWGGFEKSLIGNMLLVPFTQNEETLKACAQDYLARIKKEEQRYQTLKAHAEEKISQ